MVSEVGATAPWAEGEDMKGLRARVSAGYTLRGLGAITLLWCAALGQATPDASTVSVDTPGVIALLAAGSLAAWLVRRRDR